MFEADRQHYKDLRRCRDSAWKVICKRHHEILKVYIADVEAADILLLGKVGAEFSNGRSLTSDFTARLVLDNADMSRPKVKLYQVILVSSLYSPMAFGY